MRAVSARPPGLRRAGGSVSGRRQPISSVSSVAMTPRATKTPGHEVTFSTALPRAGAAIGATPKIRVSREKYFAAATPACRSRTIARATTTPTPPATPSTRRSPARAGAVGASAHRYEKTAYAPTPAISGRRRPHRSLSGPQTSCPTASPIRHVVSDSCTCASDTPRSPARAGNAGRYMSSDSGPIAVTSPSMTTSSGPWAPGTGRLTGAAGGRNPRTIARVDVTGP
ncbi:hypothetical protein GCM10020358_01740 [Amorphoplanes nipponensis]